MDDTGAPVREQGTQVLQPLTDLQDQECQNGTENGDFGKLKIKDAILEQNFNDELVLPVTDVVSLHGDNQLSAITLSNAEANTEKEEDDDKTSVKPLSDLPGTFSLLAPINVSYDITAHEILSMSAERILKSADFKPIFDEEVCAPSLPLPPKVEDEVLQDRSKLLRPEPLYLVKSKDEALSPDLQRHCEESPIVLIRGLIEALGVDLSKFSTKALFEFVSTLPKKKFSHIMEMRKQWRFLPDENVDRYQRNTWKYYSIPGKIKFEEYAKYQTESSEPTLTEGQADAQQSIETHVVKLKNGKRRRVEKKMNQKTLIKFLTNVDLSNKQIWVNHLEETAKFPEFCQVDSSGNMLSYLGHQVLGMNTVQLYMKVAGSRTPAHQENNLIASININIGPGDCEWFGCSYEYLGVVKKLCKKKGVKSLNDSYWPNLEELLAANVPVYRFTQKAGDLVYVGNGCLHWVQAVGACNNISWNVGPLNFNQLSMSIKSHEWNKVEKFKSLVPMQHLAWQLAKNIKSFDESMYTLIRGLLIRSLSFCQIVVDYATANGKQLKPQSRTNGEVTHYCTTCKIEVFNILFVEVVKRKQKVYCVYCSKEQGLDKFTVLQQIPMNELAEIYDGMVLKRALNNALTS